MPKKSQLILAIETSCDETAAAVLEFREVKGFPYIRTLSTVVKSQIKLHSKMGGVVPEAAARAHVKNILPVVKKSLADANVNLLSGRIKDQQGQKSGIDYIAVTQGPGLIPSLIVGVEFAKALSLATEIPVFPINHMAGHLYSPFAHIKDPTPQIKNLFPQVALIVSGGHTMLVLMNNLKDHKVIGQTVDDAAGEAFDKVAKLLGLPYPGGPEVSKLAAQAKNPVDFPRPMINSKDYNFSFSGLKTAVLYYAQSLSTKHLPLSTKSNICAGFQNAAVDVLITKTIRAAKEFQAKSISLSGGVSANTELRNQLDGLCKKNKLNFFVPAPGLRTDNAEMIGIAAAIGLQQGLKAAKLVRLQANSNLQL